MVNAQSVMHNNPTDQGVADADEKARLSWLKDGDENTSLFHQSIKNKKMQNQVYSIYDMKAEWKDTGDGVSQAFLDYYKVLLGSTSDNRTPVNREVVQQGPVSEEVKKAVFSILGIKAPGPDGFRSYFYKDAWHIVGDEVIVARQNFERDVSELRPISCCNTIYKCITKVLCGRLRQVLPDLILENQGGFVHGRYIVHNIMVVQDLVRHYGRKGVKPSCLMKIDLQKSYDTVDWQFLQEMLELLDFPKQFVDMVMQCVSTPMFSLMLNGSMHGFFKSQRGLRQGDPIAPLLFVICMEYLSRILNRVSAMPQFQFHPRCKGIGLTHLCFVDDLIICSRGDYQSIYLLLQAFKLFSNSSGLKEADIQRVVDVSGFSRRMLPFKYLGVPICSKKILWLNVLIWWTK
ncbi:uncharacterized protein [Spinacia oleracea]|uniref:Reverse transcriptase domain-containing protein n=1 Tax=Spinacia oleracea TaxID=3562 RepID=A0ABM3QQW3_SPIOL|nr:uncharacterized protein LOC130461603 [Spinacia oleracea]